jgi:hypothetical protein
MDGCGKSHSQLKFNPWIVQPLSLCTDWDFLAHLSLIFNTMFTAPFPGSFWSSPNSFRPHLCMIHSNIILLCYIDQTYIHWFTSSSIHLNYSSNISELWKVKTPVHCYWPETPQPNSDLGRCTVEVSQPNTITHTHPVRLLQTSYQLTAEATTAITYNKHIRQTSIISMGFELMIPAT